jgi:peptidoglycan/LPS O-acetylase OafA/YrhL
MEPFMVQADGADHAVSSGFGAGYDTADRRYIRRDIEGLRAVAVGLVLLYHAGLPFLPGGFVGVDVFFVISGFLITTQLLGEFDRTGRVSLVRFYSRRAKRLLPAAAVVLVTTLLLTWWVLPSSRWREIGGDIASAALYAVNWRLAERSTDYLASDSQPSPVQHFWSLAVEEQFYLIWPLLILAAGLVVRLTRRDPRSVVGIALAVVALPSFLWSLIATARVPTQAFFVTTTRLWELAIGAALALSPGVWVRLRPPIAAVAGWAGLAAVVTSGLLFSRDTAMPGYAAVLPTVGAAAVIAAGFTRHRGGHVTLLGSGPMQWLGGLSYSAYLWHWPLLVVATAAWGELGVVRGLAIAGACFLPAWLTHRWVENPVRFSPAVTRSPVLSLSIGANASLAGVVAGLLLLLSVANVVRSTETPFGEALGAAVLRHDPRDDPAGSSPRSVATIMPDPLTATQDIPDADRSNCTQQLTQSKVVTCAYGNPKSPIKVAVVGDSKATQWLPALQLLAGKNNWNLEVFAKSSCALSVATAVDKAGKPDESCTEWNRVVLPRLIAEKPDFVITSQATPQAIDGDGQVSTEAMVTGMRRAWQALAEVSSQIIVIADNPFPGMNVYECVQQHRQDLSRCTYPRDFRETRGGYPTQLLAVRGQPHVKMIDLYDAICPTAHCSPVIGNVLVYRQGSHLTVTYVNSLTPRLARALTDAGLHA